ncbi:hypothetical protein BDZ45DRAFT_744584 [Acephala macrosclerotiorum]|nr:hypothetical protein BDZ45DRAFT_744584 [Acephala macrosclerotiorum]
MRICLGAPISTITIIEAPRIAYNARHSANISRRTVVHGMTIDLHNVLQVPITETHVSLTSLLEFFKDLQFLIRYSYYYSLVVNRTTYLYDVTNPNPIAITSPNGASLVVNTTSLYIVGANCDGAIGVSVANFTLQIKGISNSTLARPSLVLAPLEFAAYRTCTVLMADLSVILTQITAAAVSAGSTTAVSETGARLLYVHHILVLAELGKGGSPLLAYDCSYFE